MIESDCLNFFLNLFLCIILEKTKPPEFSNASDNKSKGWFKFNILYRTTNFKYIFVYYIEKTKPPEVSNVSDNKTKGWV